MKRSRRLLLATIAVTGGLVSVASTDVHAQSGSRCYMAFIHGSGDTSTTWIFLSSPTLEGYWVGAGGGSSSTRSSTTPPGCGRVSTPVARCGGWATTAINNGGAIGRRAGWRPRCTTSSTNTRSPTGRDPGRAFDGRCGRSLCGQQRHTVGALLQRIRRSSIPAWTTTWSGAKPRASSPSRLRTRAPNRPTRCSATPITR